MMDDKSAKPKKPKKAAPAPEKALEFGGKRGQAHRRGAGHFAARGARA